MTGVTPHQRAVMERVLAEEEARRRHVVVALSGAHAYGFPSPDSDLDLKAIHIAPTRERLGFPRTEPAAERAEILEGVEIDYSSNELGGVLAGILKGNGNFVERVLGPWLPVQSPLLDELRPLVVRNLSQRVHRHYRGFAANQRQLAEEARTAKKVLYVLRTTATGTHLLRTGEVVTDLLALAPVYGHDVDALVAIKQTGERAALPDDVLASSWAAMDRAFEQIDAALAASVLPPEPEHADELEEWLIATRLAALDRDGGWNRS